MNLKATLRLKKKYYQAFFLICCFVLSFESTLATTVTSSSSASLNQDCGGYVILDDIVFTEDASTDFAASQTNTTYVLDFSAAGFEFKAGAGSVVHKSNRDVDASSITVTVSTVTITMTTDAAAGSADEITVSGLQLRASSATPGTYYIQYDDGASTGSWTMTDNTIHATLTVVGTSNITSNAVTNGWGNTASWVGGVIPGDCDNVTIVSGATIDLPGVENCGDLTIDNGGTLTQGNNRHLIVHGHYSNSGTHSGTNADLTLDATGKNFTSDGTNQGTISLGGQINFISDYTIPAAADITTDAVIDLAAGVTVTNNGTISMTGTPAADDLQGAGTWINAVSSILNIASDITVTTLTATATGNTVDFNGAVAQTMAAYNYYNLTSSSTGERTLASTGTIGIAGTFTSGTNSYTITGSTMDFNGSGTQTIPAFNYNNLTSSSTGARILASSGTVGMAGTFSPGTNSYTITGSTVEFKGSAAQSIATTFTFNNLTINNAAGVSLSTATSLNQTLTLTSGTFNTSGQVFTLISDASGTANIAEITGGAISGGITIQRYIAGDDDWRAMTSPVNGATLADWNGEMVMSGFPGSDDPGMSFISVLTYDEAQSGLKEVGYGAPLGIGDGLGIGQGFFVWVGDALGVAITKTVDLTAPATTGTQIIATSYTDSPEADSEDGWNLIGNPYPSDILWDVTVALSNVGTSAYVWDPNGDSFVPYTQAATGSIPSMQAFWVKNIAVGAGSVTFIESNKKADGNNFYKATPMPGLSLILAGNGLVDSTKILFDDQASAYYDPMLDAYKLYSLNKQKANLSTVTADSIPVDLSIHSIPELIGDVTIPVRIGFSEAGSTYTYTISANLASMPDGSCILLEDVFTSTITDLRVNSSYSFTQTAANNLPPRFLLHISAPVSAEVTDIACNGMANGQIVATAPGSNSTYTWLNDNNDTISVAAGVNGPDSISGLDTGAYTLIVTTNNSICPVVTQTYSITEPVELATTDAITDPLCFGGNGGDIDLAVAGGTVPYSYTWSNSSVSQDIGSLVAGSYEITVTDNNGCVITRNFNLTSPAQISIQAYIINEWCDGQENGSISAQVSGGVAPYQYLWSNGGTDSGISALAVGTYSVTVTDANGCTTNTSGIEIQAGELVIAGYTVPSSTIYLGDGGLQFTNISIGATSYTWDFGNGQSSTVENPLYIFPTPGNYEVTLTAWNGPCSSTNTNVIYVSASVGIAEADATASELIVSESNGMLNLSFGDPDLDGVNISVHNILGQMVFRYDDLKAPHGNVALNLTNLKSGVYIVRVVNWDSSRSQKFTIK